jgi:CubicO group peptidase (beta-lactamase class C family)
MIKQTQIVFVLVALSLSWTFGQPVAAQAISQSLHNQMATRFSQGDSPGMAVAIVANNALIYEEGFGVRDVETQRPITSDMLFRNGSTNKMLVASALVEILSDKNIGLDTPIGEFVEGLDESIGSLTSHQLLTHTSGLADRADDFGLHDESALKINIESKKSEDFFAEPGDVFSYSNPGYDTAGYILAYLSGNTFANALDDRVLKPAGLSRSTFRATEAMTYPFALPHRQTDDDEFQIIRPMPDNSAEWPSGLMYTTVGDLARFSMMFMNDGIALSGDRVLLPETIDTIATAYIELPSSAADGSYGYGLDILDREGTLIWQHGGAIAGFRAMITMVPERKVAIIVMLNAAANPLLNEVTDLILADMLGLESSDDNLALYPLPLAMAESIAGSYGQQEVSIRFVLENDVLVAQNQSGNVIGEVKLVDDARLAIVSEANPPTFLSIESDEDGEIKYIHRGSRAIRHLD